MCAKRITLDVGLLYTPQNIALSPLPSLSPFFDLCILLSPNWSAERGRRLSSAIISDRRRVLIVRRDFSFLRLLVLIARLFFP